MSKYWCDKKCLTKNFSKVHFEEMWKKFKALLTCVSQLIGYVI